MRLHILSDLHIEFGSFEVPPTNADVVIVAGDVHVGKEGLYWLRKSFPDKQVVYVMGNHEFYRQAIPALTETLQRESNGSHVHVLENSRVDIDGVTFLGCTLWTDFKITGDVLEAQAVADYGMSDFRLIRVSPEFRRLRARDTARYHAASVAWLKTALEQSNPARTVVVTHHAPSPRSIPPYHLGSALNAAFVSDLDSVVAASGVPLWIHGHTHHCVDYTIAETRVISNQRGYPDGPVSGFAPDLVIDI